MAAGINYFRLLWNLYRQKRNTGRKKEQVVKLQKKKLGKMLLYAYDHSPYYRKAFEAEGIFRENIRTMPLEKFPVLDKGILMEHFDELVTEQSLKQEELLRFDENSEDGGEIYLDKYHVVHSSGSTGTPRYFVYDNAAWEQMLIGIIRGGSLGNVYGICPEIIGREAENPLHSSYRRALWRRYGSGGWNQWCPCRAEVFGY